MSDAPQPGPGPQEPPHAGGPDPEDEHRRRARLRARGSGLVGSGLILIVAFVLQVSDAGYGRDPNREFGERRAYNTVKRDVHAILPRALPLALGGLVLLGLGVHLRKRGAEPGEA